jgi:predicted RNA-binding Zn ribbon-like protein
MSKNQQAPGELEHVRAFVNTLDFEDGREELATPNQLGAWLHAHISHDDDVLQASEEELRRATRLRESLRKILLAHNTGEVAPPQAFETLDVIARRAGLHLRFDRDGSSHLRPAVGGVDGALGSLLAIVHEAAGEGTWKRLKACRDNGCEWAFYDRTKNQSGAWCEMETCGNRAKARAYRERRSTTEAS